MVMVDAGCEVHGYSSDVSRSWPVSGKFSPAQRELYELVLSVQKDCINKAKSSEKIFGEPVTLDSMHLSAAHQLTQGLLDLGFMKGESLSSAIQSGMYTRYFPHAIGHYLGMDVHDTHNVPKNVPLQQNMVITVEPGLYCRADDLTAPERFRGLGLRIEDDVVVGTSTSKPEVLSKRAAKEIEDVEELVGNAESLWMSKK